MEKTLNSVREVFNIQITIFSRGYLGLFMFFLYLYGIYLSKGFWETFLSIIFIPYNYYLILVTKIIVFFPMLA